MYFALAVLESGTLPLDRNRTLAVYAFIGRPVADELHQNTPAWAQPWETGKENRDAYGVSVSRFSF